jgi:hypothetical protein
MSSTARLYRRFAGLSVLAHLSGIFIARSHPSFVSWPCIQRQALLQTEEARLRAFVRDCEVPLHAFVTDDVRIRVARFASFQCG